MSIFLDNGKEIYKGCVLKIWEKSGYHDSDFYATVWDEETKSIKEYEYATTRFACRGYAKIDFTKSVLLKANKYKAKHEYLSEVNRLNTTVYVGSFVTVIKGRKVPKNTFGKVIGIYSNSYSNWNHKVRLLLEDGSKVYTYIDNLEVAKLTINEKLNLKTSIMKKYRIKSFEI